MNTDELIEVFKKSVVEIGSRGVMAYLVAQAPVLGLPVIRTIVSAMVSRIIDILVTNTELAIYFVYTDQRTAKQAKEYEEAAVRRAVIMQSQLSTEEEKKNAEEELINRARELIRLSA